MPPPLFTPITCLYLFYNLAKSQTNRLRMIQTCFALAVIKIPTQVIITWVGILITARAKQVCAKVWNLVRNCIVVPVAITPKNSGSQVVPTPSPE